MTDLDASGAGRKAIESESAIVATRSGAIRGRREGGVLVFRGIPYADPPVGPNRFRPPRPTSPWRGILEADHYGPIAMQDAFVSPPGVPPTAGHADFDAPQSEDCLRLHVWTPANDDGRRPVMVWIHGGGFSSGAGHGSWTDGASLAATEDVVVVSLNHRLGLFGFLDLEQLDQTFAGSGNAGLLDIVAALEWVRDEIERFGGDPANVTVFGESGGGWKISCLLAMPAARGLFHRAIIQSGSYLRALDREQSGVVVRGVLDRLDIPHDGVDRILELSAEQLAAASAPVRAGDALLRPEEDGTVDWSEDFGPTVEGSVLPRHPFVGPAPSEASGIPVLIGVTEHEFGLAGARYLVAELADEPARVLERCGVPPATIARMFAATRAEHPAAKDLVALADLVSDLRFGMAAIRQAETLSRRRDAAVYSYVFCWRWPRAEDRAIHAIDIPFVFGNLTPEVTTVDDIAARELSATVGAAWAAFARTGDPNTPALPAWPTYTVERRATMMLDCPSRVVEDPRAERRRILSGEV